LSAAALAYRPKDRTVGLWFIPLGGGPPARVGGVTRAPNSPVTGATIPGTALVAIVVTRRNERDPTWGGALYVLAPAKDPHLVLEGVQAGGRVVATADGSIFVVRGVAASERKSPNSGDGFRRDALEIIEVKATSGHTRTVRKERGDALFLLGALGNELVIYRVGVAPEQPKQASERGVAGDFVAVDIRTGEARVLQPHAPELARDFSLDSEAKTLWFTAARAGAPEGERWAVHRFDLATNRDSTVATGPSMGLTPHAWPGGKVAYTCPGSGGLCISDGRAGSEAPKTMRAERPLGAGRDEVQSTVCTEEGDIALGIHQSAGASPIPFLWDLAQSQARPVDGPTGQVLFVGTVGGQRSATAR
jgi:hypothetical protein